MSNKLGETYTCEITACRKGTGNAPCQVKVGNTDSGEVVLRTIDKDDIPPIVALISVEDARSLAEGLLQAASKAE